MKINTYVNEKKRTCVCVIEHCEGELIKHINNELRQLPLFNEGFRFYGGKSSLLQEKYIGKAKCHPDDAFDADIGIELAQQRAYLKFWKSWNRDLINIFDLIIDFNLDVIDKLAIPYKHMKHLPRPTIKKNF